MYHFVNFTAYDNTLNKTVSFCKNTENGKVSEILKTVKLLIQKLTNVSLLV